ncbi:GTPase [Propionicicella superfundia]|uniref:GTPase n=1 Tax=Propionicicella superfundia TaxID=348582 RepID=UPI0003F5EB53|nr:GTPase [Propionicicella superfundia]
MTGLAERVAALGEAARLSAGRADDEVVARAAKVAANASSRLAFSGDWTVVALAGATGSGKSSLFNAITGTQYAQTGVRRPTTAQTMAAVWGSEVPTALLDWLAVTRRQLIPAPKSDVTNLVLLDLPDHDSTAEAHRLQVDRLVELVDMLVWVVDPQKYADAALHESYLIPLAGHAAVMIVALNQIDRLSDEEVQRCMGDLRRLLDAEGLAASATVAVSAETGQGVPELGRRILAAVREKQTAAKRLAADISRAVAELEPQLGTSDVPELERKVGRRLTDSLVAAAGGEVVVDAVGRAWRLRGAYATGWPMLSWIAKLRADPLRRLRLGEKRAELDPAPRTSLPGAAPVQTAQVDMAVRALGEQAATGLPRGWADAVKEAARSNRALLPGRLDAAIAGTDLQFERGQSWWTVVRVLQWLLIVAVVAGLGWLAVDFLLLYLQLPALPGVTWWGFPAQTVLAVGGALAGIVLAGVCRIGVELGARRKRVRARTAIRRSVATVASTEIVAPVTAELDRYQRARDAIRKAR